MTKKYMVTTTGDRQIVEGFSIDSAIHNYEKDANNDDEITGVMLFDENLVKGQITTVQGKEVSEDAENVLAGYESVNVMTDYDHYEEHYHKDCVLQAMEEYASQFKTPPQEVDAVTFAEWILEEKILAIDTEWFDAGNHYSSKALYEMFINSINHKKRIS